MSSCLGACGLAGEVTYPKRVISFHSAVEPEFGAASGWRRKRAVYRSIGAAAPEQAAL
jgi:hypothetical protein